MWAERMDQRFRDRAPHTVKGLSGREGEFFVCENITPMAVAGFFGAGVPSAELSDHNKRGFDAAPKSVWDPAYRIKDQDRDGVQAEVIYISMGMPRFGLDDAENDVGWMAYFMYRLDTVQNRLGAVGGMKLPMRASD